MPWVRRACHSQSAIVNWYFEHGEAHFCCLLCVTSFYYAFVLPVLEYCFPEWISVADSHIQLLERQVRSGENLCPDQGFLSLSHRLQVTGLFILYYLYSNPNHCLLMLPYASTRVRHTRAAVTVPPLEFDVSKCKTSQFARCFLLAQVHIWNDLLYTVFATGTLNGFKGVVNS